MLLFKLEGLPPSANHAYFNLPRGGRTLSTAGRRYKKETTTFIARTYPRELATMRMNEPYCVYFRLFFEQDGILNKTWPKEAKSRYKTVDVSNRVKLLEDALKDACGLDDSQNFIIIVEKREGNPATEIRLWNMQEEVPPIGELLRL